MFIEFKRNLIKRKLKFPSKRLNKKCSKFMIKNIFCIKNIIMYICTLLLKFLLGQTELLHALPVNKYKWGKIKLI